MSTPSFVPALSIRALLLAALLVATLPAQSYPLSRLPKAEPDAAAGNFRGALADIDGDGDLDLVGVGCQDRVLLNDGSGRLDRELLLGGYARHSAAAAGDFDGDGILDLLFTSRGHLPQATQPLLRFYRGLGGGVFLPLPVPAAVPGADDVAVGDFDGDGDDDAVTVSLAWPANVLLASGGTIPASLAASSVEAADVDGDSDLDLVAGSEAGPDALVLNDGRAHFTVDTTGALPPSNPLGVTRDVALGDIDGDGDVDLVTARLGDANGVFLNDGSGRFVDVTATRSPDPCDATWAVRLADVDSDGDLDWLCANASSPGRVWLNDGTGRFTDGTPAAISRLETLSTRCLAGDLDGDGDVDLVWDVGLQLRPFLRQSGGTWVDSDPARFEPAYSRSRGVALGDLDGDGVTDAFVVHRDHIGRVFRGDREGRFHATPYATLPSVRTDGFSAALGDIDGDSDLDVLLGTEYGRGPRLLLNFGKSFLDGSANLPTSTARQVAVVLADVDGDLDLDAFLGNGQGLPPALWLNNGHGSFQDVSAGALPQLPRHDLRAVACGDVDGDGDLDLVLASWLQQTRLLLNDGAGTFSDATAAALPNLAGPTSGLVLQDLDGDLDLDLLLAEYPGCVLLLNDGLGQFADASARLPPRTVGDRVTSGDFDGDGTRDIVVTGDNPEPLLLLNDGAARFTMAVPDPAVDTFVDASALAALDADGDGDTDLLYVSENPVYESRDRLFVNRVRHVHARDLARIGRTMRIEWHATRSANGGAPLVLPWFAFALLPRPLTVPGLGALHLDPATMIAGAPAAVPRATGVYTLALPVPNVPQLLGLTLYHQALCLHGPSVADWHLSNLLAETVVE